MPPPAYVSALPLHAPCGWAALTQHVEPTASAVATPARGDRSSSHRSSSSPGADGVSGGGGGGDRGSRAVRLAWVQLGLERHGLDAACLEAQCQLGQRSR
ncbi:MAG: hypothetical protein WDW36_008292 [Sanguina aurantia]